MEEGVLIMKYTIIKETIYSDELGKYESFAVQDENGNKISDISTDLEKIKKLVNVLNQKQTPANYLLYEIDSFLSET